VYVQGGKKVDLAACLLGTLQHMLTQEDVLKAFNCVKDALAPSGLFVIELNHPSQLFDGGIVASADTWALEVEEAQLEVWWGHEGDRFDPFTQVLDKSIEMDIMLRGGERKVLRHNVLLRQFTYQEMVLLAETAGFKVLPCLIRSMRCFLCSMLQVARVCAGGQDLRGLCIDFLGRGRKPGGQQ
jgi:hypothetical protein